MQAINPIVYTGLTKPTQAAARLRFNTTDKDRIVTAVCTAFEIEHSELVGKSRVTQLCDARTIAFYLLKTVAGMSYKAIGRMFGRDHSTIIYNMHKYEDLNEVDVNFQRRVYKVTSLLK